MDTQRLTRNHKLAILLVSGVICLALPVVIGINWPLIRASYFTDPSAFATTTGTITSARTGIDSGRRTYYYYVIRYDYEVAGAAYQSYRVTFNPAEFDSPDGPQSYLQKYPVGRHVTVYYDRSDPAFSVLEPNVRYDAFQVIVLALGTLLAAGVCGWSLLALLRDKPRA